MPAIVWVHRGPWAGQFREMSDEDAAMAVKEKWGQNIDGLNPGDIQQAQAGPFDAADAYFAKMTGAAPAASAEKPQKEPLQPPHSQRSSEVESDPEAATQTEPASGSGTYPTRELRASEPAKKSAPVKSKHKGR